MRLTRYRLRALARPARRWLVGLVLAGATFAGVRAALARTEAARAAWGEHRTLAVARRDLRPGERLDRATVRSLTVPAAIAADDALAPDDVDGTAVMAMPVLAGEPVRRGHLVGSAGAASSGLAAGQRALALPRPSGLTVPAGTHVDVIDAEQGAVVAHGAVVVGAAGDDSLLVAIASADVGATARAVAAGRVVLALTGDR